MKDIELTWANVYHWWRISNNRFGAAPTDEQLFLVSRKKRSSYGFWTEHGIEIDWVSRSILCHGDQALTSLNADRRKGVQLTAVYLYDALGDAERTAAVWTKGLTHNLAHGIRDVDTWAFKSVDGLIDLAHVLGLLRPHIPWHYNSSTAIPAADPLHEARKATLHGQLPCCLDWHDYIELCARERLRMLGSHMCRVAFDEESWDTAGALPGIPGKDDRWKDALISKEAHPSDLVSDISARWRSHQVNARRIAERIDGKW